MLSRGRGEGLGEIIKKSIFECCVKFLRIMVLPNVFISYNPESDIEQTLAVRLFTIGGVSGFTMQLPDRGASGRVVTEETSYRIRMSDYFLMFSTSAISPVVRQEILIASQKFQDPSRIVVIYDRKVGKDKLLPTLCTEVQVDLDANPSVMIEQIASGLAVPAKKKSGSFFTDLGGLLLAGLGLFKLSQLSHYLLFETEQLSMAQEDRPYYGIKKKPAKASKQAKTAAAKKAAGATKKRSSRK